MTSPVTTASTARTNPADSSSGTRNSRSLAIDTSATAIPAASNAVLAPSAASPSARPGTLAVTAMPHGTNRFAASDSRSPRRIASPRVTSARSGPAYSRTIASWIIVSSRWVEGLSTGSRPLSATMTMSKAARANSRCGLAAQPGGPGSR